MQICNRQCRPACQKYGAKFSPGCVQVSDKAGDRVFGENETSLCIAEIKRDDPWFNMQRFLGTLERETIPFVLSAYLEDRYEDLQTICTERSLSLLGHLIKERKEKGLKVSPHILDLEDIALMEARMVDGEPILLVTFSAQQVHCVRDKKVRDPSHCKC